MNKQPITTLLKVMSILDLIHAVLYIALIAVGGMALSNPGIMESAGITDFSSSLDPFQKISLVVIGICCVADIILSIMALMHKNMNFISRAASIVMMVLIVFSVADGGGVKGLVQTFIGAIIPILFYYAAYKQNMIDNGKI